MAGDVSLRFSGNSEDAQRAVVALEKKYESLEARIKRIDKTSRESGSVNPFKGLTDNIGSALAGVASVGTALRVLRSIYDDIHQKHEKAFNTQKTVASAF